MAIRYFSLPDDMTFFDNGAPDTSNGAIQRGGRYTWAYLLHRSQPALLHCARGPDRRGLRRPGHVRARRREHLCGGRQRRRHGRVGVLAPASRRASVNSWILDTSSEKDANGNLVGVNGLFYRVVSAFAAEQQPDEPGTADSPHQGR